MPSLSILNFKVQASPKINHQLAFCESVESLYSLIDYFNFIWFNVSMDWYVITFSSHCFALSATNYFVSYFLSIGQKWNLKLWLFFLPLHVYNFRLQYIFGNQDSRKHSSQREKAQRFEPNVIPPCIQTA